MRNVFVLLFFAMIVSSSPVYSSFLVIPQKSSEIVQAKKNEKREKRKAIKKLWREFKKKKGSDDRTALLVILSIFIPPLAVYLHQGTVNTKFWISLILSLLFLNLGLFVSIYLLFTSPAIIYSLLVVLNII